MKLMCVHVFLKPTQNYKIRIKILTIFSKAAIFFITKVFFMVMIPIKNCKKI